MDFRTGPSSPQDSDEVPIDRRRCRCEKRTCHTCKDRMRKRLEILIMFPNVPRNGGLHTIWVPQNRRFMKDPSKMDDWGVPPFQETSKYAYPYYSAILYLWNVDPIVVLKS